MKKNILILVVSVVLLSLLNTRNNFSLKNNPVMLSADYLNTKKPSFFNSDISFLELVDNLFNSTSLNDSVPHNSSYVSIQSVVADSVSDLIKIINIDNNNLIDSTYMLQIGVFKNPLSDKSLNGIDNVIVFVGKDELIRYTVGPFTTYKDAFNYQLKMKDRGFDDCFIIINANDNKTKYVGSISKISVKKDDSTEIISDIRNDIIESLDNTNFKDEILTRSDDQNEIFQADKIDEAIFIEEVAENTDVISPLKKPVIKKVFKEDPLPSDKEIIKRHPNIKENAKDLILEALEDGDIIIADVFDLLNEYAGKNINKKKVKKFIKNKRK
jgi:hypothetical protein